MHGPPRACTTHYANRAPHSRFTKQDISREPLPFSLKLVIRTTYYSLYSLPSTSNTMLHTQNNATPSAAAAAATRSAQPTNYMGAS